MFEKRKRKKKMKEKALQDKELLFKLINSIHHHYETGLSFYEQLSYFTLAVAYGYIEHYFPEDELPHLKTILYFSNINTGTSAARGQFGLLYDKRLEENINDYKRQQDLIPIIWCIIKQYNEIFPEFPRDYSQKELTFICNLFEQMFSYLEKDEDDINL